MVINSLVERFGRLPTDTEVYRFIWGGPEMRKKIWNDKGLPQTESKRETDESLSIDGKEQ